MTALKKILSLLGIKRDAKRELQESVDFKDARIQALEIQLNERTEMLRKAHDEIALLYQKMRATQDALNYEISYAEQADGARKNAEFLMVQRELIHDYAHRKFGCRHIEAAAVAVMKDRETYKRSLH